MTPTLGIDIEELRRRKALENLPSLRGEEQPTDFRTVAGSRTYQPPAQPSLYDTKAFQSSAEQLSRLAQNPPDIQGMESAAKAYATAPSRPLPTEKTPEGKDVYPRSKWKTALLAPFLWKSFLVDPRSTKAALDYDTRKGYGAAIDRWERDTEEKKRSYEAWKDVANERLSVFSKQLEASGYGMNAQRAVLDMNQSIRESGPKYDLLMAQLAHAQYQAQHDGIYMPDIEHPVKVYYREGNQEKSLTAYPKPNDKGNFPDLINPKTGEPVKDVTHVEPMDKMNLSLPEQFAAAGLAQFEHDMGRPPDDNERIAVLQDAEKRANQPAADRQLKAIQAQATAAREREKDIHFRQVQADTRKKLGDDFINPLSKKVQALQDVRNNVRAALGEKDPQQRRSRLAAALAPLEEIRKEIGTSRLNMGEYSLIKSSEGGAQGLVQDILHFAGLTGPMPEPLLKDLEMLTNLEIKDATAVLQMANKYNSMNNMAPDAGTADAAWQNFSKELDTFQNPKPTLEDEARRRGIIK